MYDVFHATNIPVKYVKYQVYVFIVVTLHNEKEMWIGCFSHQDILTFQTGRWIPNTRVGVDNSGSSELVVRFVENTINDSRGG
jgi:hypothetical protein